MELFGCVCQWLHCRGSMRALVLIVLKIVARIEEDRVVNFGHALPIGMEVAL